MNRWTSNRTLISSAPTVRPTVSVDAITSPWQHQCRLACRQCLQVGTEEFSLQADCKILCSPCPKYIGLPLGKCISSPLPWTLELVHKFSGVLGGWLGGNKKDKQNPLLAQKGHLNEKHPDMRTQNRARGNEEGRTSPKQSQ